MATVYMGLTQKVCHKPNVADEGIYMEEPPGYETGTGNIKQLRKALNSLKHSHSA